MGTLLTEVVARLVEVDDFIAKLWAVHLAVKKEGYVQVKYLNLFEMQKQVLESEYSQLEGPGFRSLPIRLFGP